MLIAHTRVPRSTRLVLAWTAVILIGMALLSLYVRGLPDYAVDFLERFSRGEPVTQVGPTSSGLTYLAYAVIGLQVIGTGVFVATAVFLLWRRPSDWFVLVVALTMLGGAVKTGLDFEPLLRADPSLAGPVAALIYGTTPLFLLAAYTFPDGHFVPRWTLGLCIVFAVWQLLAIIAPPLRWDASDVGRICYLACFVSAPIALAYRYQQAASQRQRQQLKWIVLAGVIFVPVAFVRRFVPLVLPDVLGPGAGTSSLLFALASNAAYAVAFTSLPILTAAAVSRYRLFEVDALLNRALAYAIVTTVLAMSLALGIAAAQRVTEPTGSPFSYLLTATIALVAVLAFGPLRMRVAQVIDRLLPPRAVLTVFFLDIVGSSFHAAELGDARWSEVVGQYRGLVRRALKDFDGREVDAAGDGFFVIFADAASAVRCAAVLFDGVQRLGLEVRAGIHTGVCELRGEKVSGLNVHAAARIMSLAAKGGILISDETRRAAGPAAAEFHDFGARELAGLTGRWQVHAFDRNPPMRSDTV